MMASKTSYKLLSDSDGGGEGLKADYQESELVENAADVDDEQDAKTAFLQAAGSGGLLIGTLVSFVPAPVLGISMTSDQLSKLTLLSSLFLDRIFHSKLYIGMQLCSDDLCPSAKD